MSTNLFQYTGSWSSKQELLGCEKMFGLVMFSPKSVLFDKATFAKFPTNGRSDEVAFGEESPDRAVEYLGMS